MFIGRKPDGSIYGTWTTRQPDDADHPGQEEVPDEHPDLVAFHAAQSAKVLVAMNDKALEQSRRATVRQKIEAKIGSLPEEQQEVFNEFLKLIDG